MEILLQILSGIDQALCVMIKKDISTFCKLLLPTKYKVFHLPGLGSVPLYLTQEKNSINISHMLVIEILSKDISNKCIVFP